MVAPAQMTPHYPPEGRRASDKPGASVSGVTSGRRMEEKATSVEEKMEEIGTGRIATITGRYYAMDRDRRWDRTEKAYAALVDREGLHAPTAAQAIADAYARNETDEFVQPTIISSCPDCGLQAGDGIVNVACNFF